MIFACISHIFKEVFLGLEAIFLPTFKVRSYFTADF
jgi:hypothetical protein